MILLILLLAFAIADTLCRIQDAKCTHWRAVVWWEGSAYLHTAPTRREALEWAACYPCRAHVRIEKAYRGASTLDSHRKPIGA